MKKCLCILLGLICLLTGCKSSPATEPPGTTATTPVTVPPTVPETTAPPEPAGPQQMHTVYLWTEKLVTDNKSEGGVYSRSYDKQGNMLTNNYSSNDGNTAYNEAYSYDAAGRMLTCDTYDNYGATGHTEFTYNADGKLVTEVFTNNEGYFAQTDYSYGQYGHLVKKVTTQHKREDTTLYTYNELGHLVKEEQTYCTDNKITQALLLEYTYDQRGNMATKRESRMGALYLTEEWIYDDFGNLLVHKVFDKDGNGVDAMEYVYDSAGRLEEETYYREDTAEEASYYLYDEAGRVTKKATGTPYEKFISVREMILYTYDENGNLLTEVTAKKDGTEISRREYTYISVEVPVK